jgi:hypothetical protein
VRKFGGVARDKADTLNARYLGDIFDQQRKVGLFASIHCAPVRVHILAQQQDFPDALAGQPGDFDEDIFQRARDFLSARVRHDAVAAKVAASFHDGDRSHRHLHGCRGEVIKFFDLGKGDIHLGGTCLFIRPDHGGQAVKGLRAEHQIDIWRAPDDGFAFLRGHTA